ncbi:arginase family protein [Phyllobacterium sp. 0TCS1.6C]|uniref:arginase family protein n=1 Tax=unclassified Phyllobacterium TaxID=2638441 RepID=UPI0022643E15|nr:MULTISPECIES: arginase family protein [unclassified Phyllobacterium]MCX8280131.1 arginase family protein [Phyllobacterium sp. 0TCS1.6C]MCX8294307.1 arginase family protein [Phyllobacterium sp. 0TCS1.6A]
MQHQKTLRLLFPQWQGGGDPSYMFGGRMLAWLAPEADGPVEEVTVAEPDGAPLQVIDGILARGVVVSQFRDARRRIDHHRPDRIVVLGGDCGVDLAPFAYLNERYDGELAVLWIDAHSDLFSDKVFANSHAHVLGSLMGQGDPEFLAAVKLPIKPGNALIAGWRPLPDKFSELQEFENALAERMDIRRVGPEELAGDSQPVLAWLRATGAKHVAVHFDLDVLDANLFRSLTFAKPGRPAPTDDDIQAGRMTLPQIVRLLADVAKEVDVVGLGITEHMPWDAIALREALAELPLIGKVREQA